MNSKIKLLNQLLARVKTSKNTYKASKAAYRARSGGQELSKNLFAKGLHHRLTQMDKVPNAIAEAVTVNTRIDLNASVKQLKKARKVLGTHVMEQQQLSFRRIGGRVIPFRRKPK